MGEGSLEFVEDKGSVGGCNAHGAPGAQRVGTQVRERGELLDHAGDAAASVAKGPVEAIGEGDVGTVLDLLQGGKRNARAHPVRTGNLDLVDEGGHPRGIGRLTKGGEKVRDTVLTHESGDVIGAKGVDTISLEHLVRIVEEGDGRDARETRRKLGDGELRSRGGRSRRARGRRARRSPGGRGE